MLISQVRVRNYKSFFDSDNIQLTPGFNVVVGQNNAGKTALLEAIGLRIVNNPHRSLRTLPNRLTPLTNPSLVDLAFTITRRELFELLESQVHFYVPIEGQSVADTTDTVFRKSIQELNTVDLTWTNDGLTEARFNGAYISQPNPNLSISALRYSVRRPGEVLELQYHDRAQAAISGTISWQLAQLLKGRVYNFFAERANIGDSQIGQDQLLHSNASNLAQVLHTLMSTNPVKWANYQKYVRAVFPYITQLTVPPNGSAARIMIWTVSPETQRDDLAIPITSGGTGIGQVLAMLYVVLTAEYPKTIVIDEPQSFLHPGAIRKLFEIFRQHPEHQYIFTTHSATAIASANPTTLLHVKLDGSESKIDRLDASDEQHLRAFLTNIGARLSDVFGADQVLWVEGQTEEECFPMIMGKHSDMPISATAILPVTSTGSFHKRKAEEIFNIYKRLTCSPKLMPPAIGFIFDRESSTGQVREDLNRQSGGIVRFTTRRMYENYLLNPAAITNVINSIEGFADIPVEEDAVAVWIKNNKWDHQYFGREIPETQRDENRWLHDVHGATFLNRLFSELSEKRVAYDKVKHGIALTTWICENAPSDLLDIGNTIRELLSGQHDT